MVPTFRTAGSPTMDAVSLRIGHFCLSTGDDSICQWVVMAPITMAPPSSLMPLRPGTLRRSMRCLGCARRSFIIGTRLWPPARSLASSPSRPRRPSASCTLVGAWYSNAAGYIFGVSYFRFAVGALPRPTVGHENPLTSASRGLERLPDALRRQRHLFDVVDAGRRERVDDGIDDGGGGGDRARLPGALHPEWVHRRRRHRAVGLVHGQHVGLGDGVVHHAAGQELSGLAVVDRAFPERLGDPLGDAAVHHAVDDHRI